MYSGFSGESFASASQSRTARSSEASSRRLVDVDATRFPKHTGDANVHIFGCARRRDPVDRGAREQMHAGIDVHARVVGFRESSESLLHKVRDSSRLRAMFRRSCLCMRFSYAVLMMLTLRNSATGQPCETAFSCIGWPFASLSAAPSL